MTTQYVDGRKYWNKLKQRLKDEGNETMNGEYDYVDISIYNKLNNCNL